MEQKTQKPDIVIRKATPQDADIIATAIMDAIGPEICQNLGGTFHSLDDVHDLFAALAKRDDSQYSYKNTIVAITPTGETTGVCIGYDGADLMRLRKPFIEEAAKCLGIDFENIEPECDSQEYYLDTLAVRPAYRGQGIARMLIKNAIELACASGKPAGLLVDKDNTRARRLYESVGFECIGERPFAYIPMFHMRHRQA